MRAEMSLHHEPSVCSCNNCKSNECFVKRKTLCACPDVKSFIAKADEEFCLEAKKKNETDIIICHQSGKDISECCKSLSGSSKVQHTHGHSDSNLTELTSSGTDRNDELIKVINETITQKLRSDVRHLLEEFRKCLIDITTKENNLKALNSSETKKVANRCCSEDRAPSKTVSACQDTNDNILFTPIESQVCNLQCQSADKAKKIDHLIETAKLMKLDGGVEYRHEQFIRNYDNPHKKYGEFITKDEIITTKTYSNSKTRGQKIDKAKDDRKIESFNVNITQKYVDNSCSKLCGQETNKNSLKNTMTSNGPKDQTEQCTTCADVPKKSWRCMIIEDKGSNDNNKSANPSYYILEKNACTAKPKVISVDNTWLTKHLFSNQEIVSKDHYPEENIVIMPKARMPSLPTKQDIEQMTAKELKDDCECWSTLEDYLKALSGSQIKSESEPNECCVVEKEHYVDIIKKLKDEEPKKCINDVCNTSIPTDNIDLLLETLIEKQQMYRCKCSIVKTQCHKSHCCALNEDVCILEKIRAQANRVRQESKQNPENIPPKVFCDSCKKYIPKSHNNGNQCCPIKPDYKNISHENSISTGTQPQAPSPKSENVYYSCDMCGTTRNKNYQKATKTTVNDNRSEGNETITTSIDQIIPTIHITPYDILNKLKEAYKACSCKVCACVSRASKCDEPAKNKSTKSAVCQCDPCETSTLKSVNKTIRETSALNSKSKTIHPTKWNLRGISKKPDEMKDIIFGLGKRDDSCTCLPCDCITCLKLNIIRCACKPCECLNCNSKDSKRIDKKYMVVAPVEEELRGNVCTCDPCQCESCGISMAQVVETHEVSTEMAIRACDCEVCHNESCQLGGTDNCLCLSQNTIVTKPVANNQNDYDIRTVVIQNQFSTNEGCNSCNESAFKGPYAAFAALTDNKPHFFSTKKKTVSCLCEECECLDCDKQFCGFEQNENEISSSNNCKCSTCECEVCPNRNTDNYVKQCQCSVCECIECENMPDFRNTVSPLPLIQHRKNSLECYGDACSCETCVCEQCCDNCPKKNIKSKQLSKINFMLPLDKEASNTVLKYNTISRTSTANATENPSWSRTTNVTSDRIYTPSSCMKHVGSNDIPTKDGPNLFFDPEYDYIQDLINYKTRSLKKALDEQTLVSIQPIPFTPAPSMNDSKGTDTNDNTKLMPLKSAKAILSRKKMFDTGTPSVVQRVEKFNYAANKKKSTSSSPRKSSLNLLVKSDDSTEKNFGGKWIKESDFVLRRCETKTSNFAGSYIKGTNMQYAKTSDVLINAKRFSLRLLKILEKYEKANQEFQSVTAKNQCLKKQNSIQQEMINGFVGYLQNFSILYQNKSDLNVNTAESQSYELDFKESLTKGGFVLDMRRQNTYENLKSFAIVTENRETFDICRYIIVMLINSLSTAKRTTFKTLSKVRTILNLPTKNNHLTKPTERSNIEQVTRSKYDLQNINKEKNGLQIMSSRSLIQSKSPRNAKITLENVKRSTILESDGQHVEIYDDSKEAATSDSRSFQMHDSKSPKLETSKVSSSAEENEEVEVTVCVSTADMNSLRSMEGNYVYVINNNRHPIREFLDDPSLHILKKNNRLDEVLYPKLSPAYPSMQYDIKTTLHSMPRHEPSETGPSSTRHLLHTMTKKGPEQKVVETTSQNTSINITNREDSSFPDNTLNVKPQATAEKSSSTLTSCCFQLKIEDQIIGDSSQEQRVATPVKRTVDKELSYHRSCDTTSSSFEALKAHFLGVTRISNHTAIIKWNKPQCLDGVCGYELLIDGKPVKTGLSPSLCIAVVTCIPQSEKVQLTIRTIVEQTGGVQRFPTSTTEYHPRNNS